MSRPICNALAGRIFVCLLICLSLFAEAAHANVAGPRITIGQAKWAQGVFSVKGTVRHGAAASVDIYDSSGRLLGQATVDSRHRFALSRTDLDRPELLCSVRAKATDAMATAAVKGRPKSCGKVPQCKIFSPVGSVATTVNTDVSFSAKATLKDKKANPLKMEWDFGGGSMGEAVPGATPATFLRPTGTETTVQFVRDNGRYRARFTAWDQRNRYCEDSVEVIVGTPPDTLEEFAATRDAVAGLAESARQSAPGLAGAGSGKVVLPFEDWTLQNITDARTAPNLPTPFGPQVNTINAVVYGKAKMPVVLGDDSIELSYSAAANPADPAGKDSINTTSQNWPVDRTLMQAAVQKSDFFEVWSGPADVTGWSYAGRAAAFRVFDPLTTVPDEGYHNPDLIPALNPDHGRYMPGIGGPYAVNEPQAFSEFVADSNGFAAKMLPVTDIDDLGRVNPYPLFRVTAKDKATGAADSTDLVLTAGRDLHCRECHAKGGIGARAGSAIHHHDHSGHGDGTAEFFEPASSSLFDQEYAALRNVMVIHGLSDFATGPLSKTCADSGCHKSAIATVPYGQTLPGQESSIRVHGFHGVLQYNAARDDIQRDDQGLPVRFKPAQTDAAAGSNPNSLFPVKDAEGHILPMEQNCLRCHAGLREQCYRDRMYGAAVTCYQCHGDMLAVAGSYPKSSFSPDGNAKREAWIDQPDCASCHIGTGNRGKLGTDGFFSAGVLRTAFDETDPSATPRRPDRFNPDEGRFAVTPVTDIKLVELGNGELLPFSVALFRQGKDRHGQVPCAACHGAAHAVWPNRDPNANDNVTALQLQGHAGPIAACNTCHTPEAFEHFEDLDQGLKAPEPKVGVLGGPHNLHPVDDPNWWQQAAFDTTPNASSGKVAGGWHNDYAKLPGAAGEDQCAACHGNDHRGTRLSRTPVDRSFVTEKGKTVRVKAGDAIGCDLCHSVRKSCTGSPNPDCGKPSEQVAGTTNQAPVFATQPPSEALIGKDYRYAVHANDPEGEAIRYSTSWLAAGGLTIDPQSGVLSIAAANLTGLPQNVDHEFAATDGHYPPFLLELRIIATDARGAYAVQPVKIGVDCPADLIWSSAEAACAPIGIISSPTTNGLNEGEIYTYAVKAETRGGAPVTYGLSEGPEGMHIDAATGLLSWVAIPSPGYGFNFTVTATDGQGHTASQSNIVLVCTKPDQWDTGRTGRGCVPLITLSSQPSRPGLNVGESYDYRLEAIHREGLPLTFTLDQPPLGMTIDGKTGALHWIAQAESSTTLYPRIDITDSNGYSISQTLNVTVCAPPDRWREEAQQCHGPIDFTSESPVAGLVAGETFDYAVTATHRDGLPIAFALTNAPADMSFDAKTCVLHWVAASNSDGYISFTITASDSRGASTTQDVGLSICASGMRWDVSLGCQGPVVIEPQTVFGIDAGATYTYAVKASLPGGGPVSFGLADAPAGMAIDSASGVVTWVAVANPNAGSPFGFTVIASDDQGRQTIQYGNLMVCESPQHWNNEAAACQ